MRLVHGIGVVVAKLLDDLLDAIEILSSCQISDNPFKTMFIVSFYDSSDIWGHVVYSSAPTFLLS